MKTLLIKNTTVATLGEINHVLKDHAVLCEGNTIKAIGPSASFTGSYDEVIDGAGKVLLPGFINAHMHFYSSFACGLGKAKPAANFVQVLENLWWNLDKKLTLDDTYYSTLVACVRAIQKGCTSLVDHHASPFHVRGSLAKVKDAMELAGLRGDLCYELSDRDGAKITQDGLDENVEFIKWAKEKGGDRFKGHFGLHAAFTIEDDTMIKAAKLGKELGAGFHIHVAEDKADQDHSLKHHGMRVVERLHKLGILGKDTICGHCVHVSSAERKLLAETDTIVVNNIQSNMNNAVGIPDPFALMEEGVLVGMGTDAMTTNMLEELRCAMWAHKHNRRDPACAFMEVTGMLVHNNRRILDRFFGPITGEIAVGKKADIILMDYHPFTDFDSSTFLGHLVFGLSQTSVDTTIADGKVLMKNKVLTHLDEKEIAAKAHACAAALWERF